MKNRSKGTENQIKNDTENNHLLFCHFCSTSSLISSIYFHLMEKSRDVESESIISGSLNISARFPAPIGFPRSIFLRRKAIFFSHSLIVAAVREFSFVTYPILSL